MTATLHGSRVRMPWNVPCRRGTPVPDTGPGHYTGGGTMSGVYKSIEMVGTSGTSFDDAARVAVKRAGESMRDLEWMEVVEQRGYIKGGEVHEFQVKVKLWFKLEGGGE